MPIASTQCSTCSSVGWPGRMSASSCTADAACDPAPAALPSPTSSRGAAPSSTCSASDACMIAVSWSSSSRSSAVTSIGASSSMIHCGTRTARPVSPMCGTSRSTLVRKKVSRRAAEEAGNPPAAHVADGLEALDGVAHRVEARGRQLQGIDGANAGDEKQEAPGQVALARLVVAAGFGIADATVVLAEHGLAAAEDADRPAPRVVHRNGGMAHAVARLAIGRILRPEALVVGAAGRQLVRHDALPVVCREHDGEAVQPPALAAVLAVGIEDLLHDLGIREVLRPHGEPGHVARDEWGFQLRHGF